MAILLVEESQSNIVEGKKKKKKRDPKYLVQNAYTYHIHRINDRNSIKDEIGRKEQSFYSFFLFLFSVVFGNK